VKQHEIAGEALVTESLKLRRLPADIWSMETITVDQVEIVLPKTIPHGEGKDAEDAMSVAELVESLQNTNELARLARALV